MTKLPSNSKYIKNSSNLENIYKAVWKRDKKIIFNHYLREKN
jgi:hypothetical protein